MSGWNWARAHNYRAQRVNPLEHFLLSPFYLLFLVVLLIYSGYFKCLPDVQFQCSLKINVYWSSKGCSCIIMPLSFILVKKRQYYRLSQSFLGQLIGQKDLLSWQANILTNLNQMRWFTSDPDTATFFQKNMTRNMFCRVVAHIKHCPLYIQNINLNLFKLSESVHMNGLRWMVGDQGYYHI